jgi:hypothetical protein
MIKEKQQQTLKPFVFAELLKKMYVRPANARIIALSPIIITLNIFTSLFIYKLLEIKIQVKTE